MRTMRATVVLALSVGCTTDAGYDPPFGSMGSGPDTSDGSVDSSGAPPVTGTETTDTPPATGDVTGASSSEDDGGALCGDGVVSGNEECDCQGLPCTDAGLDGKTCLDIDDPLAGVLTGGELSCNPASCRFDTSTCTHCGDGSVNGNEACDGELREPITCRELGRGTAGEVTCGSDCQLDASACTACGYTFDFSSCAGWTTGRTDPAAANPSWACGEPTGDPPYGPPGAFSGAWATGLTGYYSANESSFLQSPPLDFTRCAGETLTMSLSHWFNFESLTENADGGIVQVSADGESWTTLVPTSGTEYGTDPIIAAFPPVNGAVGFDGSITADESDSVLTTELDLSDYAGESGVYVRFVFGSNASSVTAGWYIDSVEILGSGGG